MHTDLKHYLSFSLAQGLKIAFSMAGMAVLARFLGPQGLGEWTMVVALGSLLHLLLVNWIQQDALMRFGKEEWIRTGTVVNSWNARLPFIATGILLALILLLINPGGWIQRFYHLSPFSTCLAFCFFISILVTVEMQALLQITAQMIRLAFAPVWVAGLSVLLYAGLGLGHLSSQRVEIALSGVILITIGVWIIAGFRTLQQARIGLATWDRKLTWDMLAFAWPLLPAMVLNYVVNWGNQVLIQRSFSSHEVGLYQSAFQVHGLIIMQAVPFTTIILPQLIGKHMEDPTIMKRYTRVITPTLFCLWLLVMIPTVAILPFLYTLVFGRSFLEGVPVLTMLLAASPLCALGQMYAVLYTVQNKMGKILIIMIIMGAINLAGTVWIMPRYGITWAAGSYGLAFLASQGLTYLYQHLSLKTPTTKMNSLLGVLVLFSLGQLMISSLPFRLLWACGMGALLIGIVRGLAIADTQVVDRLFTGRLQPIGKVVNALLLSRTEATA